MPPIGRATCLRNSQGKILIKTLAEHKTKLLNLTWVCFHKVYSR